MRYAGFESPDGFVGFLPDGTKRLFSSLAEYTEYIDDLRNETIEM